MQRFKLHELTDWNGGITDDTAINTLLYSYPNNFAALIPVAPPGVTTTYSGVQLFNGNGSATKNGGNAWVSLPSAGGPAFPNQVGAMVTTQTNDTLTIPVPAGIESVQIVLAGIVPGNLYRSGDPVAQSAAIRNGCRASITVDGVLITTVDTYNAVVSTPGLLIFSGVGTHTIVVKHTGTQDAGVPTPSMLAVVQVAMSTGGVVTGGVYTSPVMDSLDDETAWFASSWSETPLPNGYPNDPSTSLAVNVNIIVGNTLVNDVPPFQDGSDGSGVLIDATASGGIADGILYAGSRTLATDISASNPNPRIGVVGYPDQAVGRYAQIIFTFGITPILNPYIIDMLTYAWVPQYGRDDFLAYLFQPPQSRIGPNMISYIGALAMIGADKAASGEDVIASYAISTATSQYLPAIGAERGLPLYSGENPDAYRARILAATRSYSNGGSAVNICHILCILVMGNDANVPVQSVVGGFTSATCGGVVVTGGVGLTYTVSIPPAPYPGLLSVTVALARTIIADLINRTTPVGFFPTTVFN